MKPWMPIVTFVLFAIFGGRYYVCKIKRVCDTYPAVVASAKKAKAPITFNWSSETPVINGADSLIQTLSEGLGEGQVIQITGRYFNDEDNNTDFQDLGLARASHVKAMLEEVVDPQKIRILSEGEDGLSADHQTAFESVAFDIIDIDASKAEILDLGDKIVILFPYQSIEKEPNAVIDEYLDRLADELKTNGAKVVITGHADNVGSARKNKAIGLRRAKNIRDFLIKKGVSRKAIVTKSKGDTEPVATNDSPVGRHQNRRVEITIK